MNKSNENAGDLNEPPIGKLADSGRLGGIDFGTVRVGIAISDPSQTIASPLATYVRRNQELDKKYFSNLARDEQIIGWIVGLPVHMSGDASAKSKQAIEFGRWLAASTELPVDWIDERYTTAMARDILSQSNLSGKKRKAQLDRLAAQILLAAYLESGPGTTTALA